jgi:hypothetical protein
MVLVPRATVVEEASSIGQHRRVTAAPDSPKRTREGIETAVQLVGPVVVIGALFLSLYTARDLPFPVGYDTPKYIWRSTLVEAQGPEALDGSAQFPLHVNADRPGYPVLSALLHVGTRITAFDLTFVLPAVMAVAIGLAAGAFALRVLREPRWAFAVYAIGVGASVNVARIAVSYADTLIASVLLLAAATAALIATAREGALAATIVLVTGAVLVHWNFAVVFALVLLALAVVLVPESLRERRGGASIFGTPSGRLVALVGGSAVAGAAGMALGPAGPQLPGLGRPDFVEKLSEDAPRYKLWATGPLAAGGLAALWFRNGRLRRWGMALALVWALSAAGTTILLVAGAAIPAHRFLSFAFGIPILVTAALVGAARWSATRWRAPGRAIGALLVLTGLAAGAFLGHRVWFGVSSWMRTPRFVQSQQIGQYLEQTGGDRPVVFVVDRRMLDRPGPVNLFHRVIRAGLPGDQIPRTYVYLGDPRALLAGRPTTDRGERYEALSQHFFIGVRPALDDHPIVVVLHSFDPFFDQYTTLGEPITEDILVIDGPPPSAPLATPSPPTAKSGPTVAGLAASVLVLLAGVGLGWSAWLVPGSWHVKAALAPAFGISLLVILGVVVGRLGFSLTGGPAITVIALAGTGGWIPLLARGVRAAPSAPPSPPA